MRKLPVLLLAVLAVLVVPVFAFSASTKHFHASMNGKQETPTGSRTATGTATFTLSSDGKKLSYVLKASKLSGKPQAAHIHLGQPGKAGAVIIALKTRPFTVPAKGTVTKAEFAASGNVKSFASAIKAMRDGRTYVNLHTVKFPGGEVRGQIKTG